MDHKQAALSLVNLLKKEFLTHEEKEALGIAIGVLSWTALAKSRIKNLKAKRDWDTKH